MVFDKIKQFMFTILGRPLNFILDKVDEPMEKVFWNIAIIIIWSFCNWGAFNLEGEEMSYGDAFYYTMTVHFTIGFGDISPKGWLTRFLYYLQIFIVWFINMVPAGLKVFDKINRAKKLSFPQRRYLDKQMKFRNTLSKVTPLPRP